MTAQIEVNAIRLENEPPRLDSLSIITVDERNYRVSTVGKDDEAILNPRGRIVSEKIVLKHTDINSYLQFKKYISIATWNVRTMNNGNTQIITREMGRNGIDLMGISETKWKGIGQVKYDDYSLYFSGNDKIERKGVAFICTEKIKKCVLGFNPISDRIITIRIQGKPIHFTFIQVYAPTSTADEEEMDYFYDALQKAIDITPKGDIMYVIGDWNAKVGKQKTAGFTGGFGLGTRNERGDTMVDFCSRNSLVVMNTMFKQHARRLYTWKSPDKITKNQIDYILCTGRWKISIKRVTTIPRADCGTDHNFLIAIVKIKFKQTKRNKTTPKYDLENIATNYTVEVKNRFSILQVDDKNPEDLWIDIRDVVIETAEKLIPKLEKRKVTKWLTEETIKIAEERREAKRKGEIEKYKKLNAEFQKKSKVMIRR